MTTLREELDWITRPFSLAPPIPEEVFTECVDNLSAMIGEEFEGSRIGGDYQPERGEGPSDRERLAAAGTAQKDKQSGARNALRQFSKWLDGMGDHFPKAARKLGRLQDQVAKEIERRPDKMLQAIANWGKNKMLPQFAQRIDKTGNEYQAMKNYYDELNTIIGVAA